MSAPRSKLTLNSLALQLYEDGIMSAIISMYISLYRKSRQNVIVMSSAH